MDVEDVLKAVVVVVALDASAQRRRQSRSLMLRWPITSLLARVTPMPWQLPPQMERKLLLVAIPPWTMRCFE